LQVNLERNPSGDVYFSSSSQIKQFNYDTEILDNIRPPPFVSRNSWGATSFSGSLSLLNPSKVKAVQVNWQSVVTVGNTTTTCDFICALKAAQTGTGAMPYHFVIASDGTIYEAQPNRPQQNTLEDLVCLFLA